MRCPIDTPIQHKNSWSFSGPPLYSQREISFEKAFYRLSQSHRFNMESLSRFSLAVAKDGIGLCFTLQG